MTTVGGVVVRDGSSGVQTITMTAHRMIVDRILLESVLSPRNSNKQEPEENTS